jgi:hypothetical protein
MVTIQFGREVVISHLNAGREKPRAAPRPNDLDA